MKFWVVATQSMLPEATRFYDEEDAKRQAEEVAGKVLEPVFVLEAGEVYSRVLAAPEHENLYSAQYNYGTSKILAKIVQAEELEEQAPVAAVEVQ